MLESSAKDQLIEEGSPRPASPEVYRAAEGLRFSLGQAETAVYCWHNLQTRLLTPQLANLWGQCRRMATLEEHAHECCRALGIEEDRKADVISALERLRAEGLLVPPPDWVNARQTVPDRAEIPTISSVCMATRDRPESLRACLTSYLDQRNAFHWSSRLIIADDAPDSAACRALVENIARQRHTTIWYAGFEEKRQFEECLARECETRKEIIHFALFGLPQLSFHPGANRNALLLETAGTCFFGVDDDTLARVVVPPDGQPGIAFTNAPDPADIWFYPSRSSAFNECEAVPHDLLRSQEGLLGTKLVQCLGPDVDMAEMPPRMLRELQMGNGHIVVTLPGIVGDSGMGAPRWLGVRGATRQRLLASNEAYENAFLSRNILRATRRCTVSSSSFFMSYAAGFDNRTFLPPFVPVERNSDGIFGLTLRKCAENAYIAHLPWAVQHSPLGERRCSKEDLWRSFKTSRVADLLILCINSFDFWPGTSSPPERLRTLGRNLQELAGLPLSGFQEFLRIRMCQQFSRMLADIEEQVRSADVKPTYWLKDVEQYSRCLKSASVDPEVLTPADLKAVYGRDAATMMQKITGLCGEVFRCWSDLVQSTLRLREQGITLAKPLGTLN